MAFTMNVHQRDKQGNTVKSRPYVRLKEKDEPALFLQDGKIYTEDGKEVEEVPEWASIQAGLLSKKAKQEVKYKE